MINVRMQHKEVKKLSPKITVVGVGGAGGNAVNNMITSGLEGVEFVVCNTDAQALDGSLCENKVQLGMAVTGGLGAGARPEVGGAAAEESLDDVLRFLDGANMAFITAGMGGGTGTGAAPVIAKACRDKGILTIGVVTKPFHFEGALRMKMAEAGIAEMQDYVDTLIVIPNQNLFRVANEKTTFADAFKMADGVLQSGVRGVTDLMVMPGMINLDFADIRTAMMEMGKAMMGTGEATGERRAVEAAEAAINNPLLDDVSMKGAHGVIINVTGGYDMTLFEVDEACNRIRDEVDPNANIIFGSTFDGTLDGVMRVSVFATGIDVEAVAKSRGPKNVTNTVLNALTSAQQAERRVDRTARPADAVVAPAAKVTAPAQTSAPVRPTTTHSAVSAPVRTAATSAVSGSMVGSAARKMDQSVEMDMFEQQAVEVAPVQAYVQEQAQVQVQVQETVQAQQSYYHQYEQQAAPQPVTRPTQDSMRGSRYGESFIPPRAVEPERQPDVVSYGAPAPMHRTVEAPVQPSGLTLRPPSVATQQAAQPKKRTPSIFERFTRRHEEEDVLDVREQAAPHAGESHTNAGGLRAGHHAPVQQALAIDAPVATKPGLQNDEDLDIPAFLRRQAN